jgi:RimJ/RimL family protein N-acetyltransferase
MSVSPRIETPRLILRRHVMEDFEPYAAMWADPGVVRHIGGVSFTWEQVWTRFMRQAGIWHFMGFGFFAIEERATGAFIGEAGFHELRRDLAPSLEGTLEAGWAFIPEAQGKGYAQEAVGAALDWAASAFAAMRVTCIIEPDNLASLRLAAKLGFREFARTLYHSRSIVLFDREPATAAATLTPPPRSAAPSPR